MLMGLKDNVGTIQHSSVIRMVVMESGRIILPKIQHTALKILCSFLKAVSRYTILFTLVRFKLVFVVFNPPQVPIS